MIAFLAVIIVLALAVTACSSGKSNNQSKSGGGANQGGGTSQGGGTNQSANQGGQQQQYKDGVYNGFVQGEKYNVSVTMNVAGGKIKNVDVKEPTYDQVVADKWAPVMNVLIQVPQRVVGAQSTTIEAVTGATNTYTMMMTAINKAIDQAKGGASSGTSGGGTSGGGSGGGSSGSGSSSSGSSGGK
jgi:uncharacterized protein with FMN-binding domain